MKLIVGLGNPGREYSDNRHNVGFMCLNHLAKINGITIDHKEGKARTGKGEIAEHSVLLAKPQTYMNLSGESVRQLMAKYRIDIKDLLVVHDDLDLPLGKLRLRNDGGSGGHKGIESIIACLGTKSFLRLRIGIGRPEPGSSAEASEEDIIAYVLSGFNPEEKQIVADAISRADNVINLCLLEDGPTAAMNKYNR